jgi:hypothetical protein
MTDTYRGWSIHYDPPPIPIRSLDWQATGPNYDASYEGEEDGWVDNGEKATARTREELIAEIDNWFDAEITHQLNHRDGSAAQEAAPGNNQ